MRLSPGRHDAGLFHLPGSWVGANLPKRSEDVEAYLERPKAHQYLAAFNHDDLERLKLRASAATAAPMTVLPKAPEPPVLPPPPAEDDITGKLRRLIARPRRLDDDENDDEGNHAAAT